MSHEKMVVEERFSPRRFIVVNSLTLAVLVWVIWAVCRYLHADNLWNVQIHALSSGEQGLTFWIFMGSQLSNCFVEWVFHRYVLHAPIVPFFRALFVKHHKIHHMVTLVIPKKVGLEALVERWISRYPMIHVRQYASSFFPDYTYIAFTAIAMIFIIPVQLKLPEYPILIVYTISLLWSLSMYEFIHFIEHFSEDFWKKCFSLRFIGRHLELAHSHHITHHVFTSKFKWNMNISGFLCGIPLADWFFGTLKLLPRSIMHDRVVDRCVLRPPKIRWFARWLIEPLDRYADRKVAEYLPRKSA